MLDTHTNDLTFTFTERERDIIIDALKLLSEFVEDAPKIIKTLTATNATCKRLNQIVTDELTDVNNLFRKITG